MVHSASTSSIQSNATTAAMPNEFRPMKSIIVGGGQPIIVPGSNNTSNNATRLKSSLSSDGGSGVSSASGFIASIFNKIEVNDALPLHGNNIVEAKVASVEEFCPDGGLDKSFLDDLPSQSNSQLAKTDDVDSDR